MTIAVLLPLAACAPQAELVKMRGEMNDLRAEVRKEVRDTQTRVPDISGIQKRVDQLEDTVRKGSEGSSDVNQRLADQGARFDQLVTDLQILQGKVEENNFRLKELSQKLDDKTYKVAELAARVDQLENRLKSQSSGTTAAPAADAKPVPKGPSPSEAYQQAKADFDKGSFDLAIAGFENYLALFPDASQADAAQYWLGECWYSKKEYGKAIDAFEKVLKNHPKSEKAPGARLKIGYSYLNEKNAFRAKEVLNRVIKEHPGTREAELAKEKLAKMPK